MRRRTQMGLVVPLSLLGAFSLFLATFAFEAKTIAQVPEAQVFKVLEVKLKDKEPAEKAKEKNKARSSKEKADFAPIEAYYRDYLIPQLTQPSSESINLARKEFKEDMDAIEKNKELLLKFNAYFLKEMKGLVLKGADGKVYHPSTRINAAWLLSEMKSEPNPNKLFTGIYGTLLEMLKQRENDGLIASGLFTLNRHLKIPGLLNETGRATFGQALQGLLTTPAPLTRDIDAHNYLLEQVIECLTEIAKTDTDKDASKLAVAALSPALIKIIDEQKSEWLVETALQSFGSIKHGALTAEDAMTLEKAIAKFTKQSLKDWRKRISNSGGLVGGGMGGMGPGGSSGMGGMGGMGPGGMGPGGSSGSGGGRGGSSEGGFEGGSSGLGGAPANRPKRPFEDQPKEVKNARRIAHQRFERIHMALDGYPMNSALFLKKIQIAQPKAKLEERGLVTLVAAAEKEKVVSLMASVDAFQKELNDEKVADLSTLTVATTKSVKQIRAECDLILGETKVVVIEEEEGLVPSGPGK